MMFLALAPLITFVLAGPVAKRQGSVAGDVLPDVTAGSVYYDPPMGNGRTIRAYGRPDLCLTAQGGKPGGMPTVELSYCYDPTSSFNTAWSKLQTFNVTNPSAGHIRLQDNSDAEYCLDAGNNPVAGDYVTLQICGHNPGGNAGQDWQFPSEDYLQGPNNLCLAIDPESHLIRAGPYDIQKLLSMQPCNAVGNGRDNNQVWANSGVPA